MSKESPAELEHRPAVVAQRCLNGWAEVWWASHTQASDQSLPFDWLTRVSPQEATPISVEEIRAKLKKPSGPGRGIDEWDKPMLATLTDQALIILAKLFSAVQREVQCPSPGGGTTVVLLSKGQGHVPLHQRPTGKLARQSIVGIHQVQTHQAVAH